MAAAATCRHHVFLMLPIALATSLGALAYLVFVGSSIAHLTSSVGGAIVPALLVTSILLTTASVIRRLRSSGSGKTGPFVTGVVVSVIATVYAVLLLAATRSSDLLASLAPLEFSDRTGNRARIEAMQAWALPADPQINALTAGEGALRLALPASPIGRGRVALRPMVPLGTPPWPGEGGSPLPAEVFPNHRVGGSGLSAALIDSLPRTLTAGERAFLQRVAEAPHWSVVGMVARAPHVDLLGAYIALPVPDDVDIFGLPIPPTTMLRGLGQANAARIAFHLQRGDRAAARLAAQELLSLGLRLADASRFELGMSGISLARTAHEQLIRTLRATGDPEAERMVAARSEAPTGSPSSNTEQPGKARDAVAQVGATLMHAVRDPLPPSLRWEALRLLGILPCANTRTLVFGADAETRETLAFARAELARNATDSLLVTLTEETPERRSRRGISPDAGFIEWVLQTKARVLGTSRIVGCMTGFI